MYYICNVNIIVEYYLALFSFFFLFIFSFFILFFFFFVFFFFSSRRRHTRSLCDWVQTCALPIWAEVSLVEINEALRKTVAGRYAVRQAWADLETALAGRPTAAVIATPAPLHVPIATRLAERSEEHTSELQSHSDLVCRLLLEKKK